MLKIENLQDLTFGNLNGIIYENGELSERFKELVLKTSDSERNLGFESLTLRQQKRHPSGWRFCFPLEDKCFQCALVLVDYTGQMC